MERTASTTARVPRTVRFACYYLPRPQAIPRRRRKMPEAVKELANCIGFWIAFIFFFRLLMLVLCA